MLFGDITQVGSSANAMVGGLVPSDTPYIQWKRHKFNVKKFIFPTMKACFEQFEDALESRNIDIESNWKRIIKPKMSTGMANWTRELIAKHPTISWGQFRSRVKAKYSSSEAEERKAALNKLKSLKLDNCDSLEDYIDKFNTLKQLAGVHENTTLVDYFLRGLDIELYASVSNGISQARGIKGSNTLDFAISQLRSAYDLFRRDDYYIQEKKRKDEQLNNKIKETVRAYQRSEASSSGSRSYSKETRRAGRFHDKKHYSSKANDQEVLKCYECGFTPFTYAHKAVCKKNPKNMKKAFKKKSKAIVLKPTAQSNDTDSSSSDEGGDQNFAVATISTKGKNKDDEEVVSMDADSECKQFKSEYFKKMPSDNMNTNGLLYLPVILEAKNGILVNTWFLLDTGCTFNAISPQLRDFMKLNVINKDGIIKLDQNNSAVERKRQTAEEIKINYGSKIVYSKFEVFDLFDDVHCVFDIEPNPYKPNADPYGSEEERQWMMNELKPSIDANSSISPKAYCSLPDSKIALPIKKNTPLSDTCRRQFPIAEAMRPII